MANLGPSAGVLPHQPLPISPFESQKIMNGFSNARIEYSMNRVHTPLLDYEFRNEWGQTGIVDIPEPKLIVVVKHIGKDKSKIEILGGIKPTLKGCNRSKVVTAMPGQVFTEVSGKVFSNDSKREYGHITTRPFLIHATQTCHQ